MLFLHVAILCNITVDREEKNVFTCGAQTEHHELWISEAPHTFSSGALKPGSLLHNIKSSITILLHSPSLVICMMKKTSCFNTSIFVY